MALEQQGLHDTGKPQDSQEETQQEPMIGNIIEARDLKPDQSVVVVNTCK